MHRHRYRYRLMPNTRTRTQTQTRTQTRIIVADVFDGLAQLPDESVDCVVTSPPYWGLRQYFDDPDDPNAKKQIGLEPTLDEHLAVMVRVGDEIRRVLKPSGTFWLNYGDTYAATPNGRSAAETKAIGERQDDRTFRDKPVSTVGGVLKPKDLCMLPNRLAIRLQEDGWWVRSEIIWGKNCPLPDSAKDRPGIAHEKIWLLTKASRYFYNHEDVRVKSKGTSRSPRKENYGNNCYPIRNQNKHSHLDSYKDIDSRNLRNYEPTPTSVEVWNITPYSFSGAHFATFPPELAERCIKAGCPPEGVCLDPFGGSGTVGLVANRLNRDCILIELNPEYAEMARKRIDNDAPILQKTEVTTPKDLQTNLLEGE